MWACVCGLKQGDSDVGAVGQGLPVGGTGTPGTGNLGIGTPGKGKGSSYARKAAYLWTLFMGWVTQPRAP